LLMSPTFTTHFTAFVVTAAIGQWISASPAPYTGPRAVAALKRAFLLPLETAQR
jgi:hypothetical protein